jgi:hypothetical protein
MPPKKNFFDIVLTKTSVSDMACDAYCALRKCRMNAYGLDIFLKRGMLEWMLAIEEPVAATYRGGLVEDSGTSRNEIVAILVNIMEGRYGI